MKFVCRMSHYKHIEIRIIVKIVFLLKKKPISGFPGKIIIIFMEDVKIRSPFKYNNNLSIFHLNHK